MAIQEVAKFRDILIDNDDSDLLIYLWTELMLFDRF
jgi:hypothetical protein